MLKIKKIILLARKITVFRAGHDIVSLRDCITIGGIINA